MDIAQTLALAAPAAITAIWMLFHHHPRAFKRISGAVIEPMLHTAVTYLCMGAVLALSIGHPDIARQFASVGFALGGGLVALAAFIGLLVLVRRLDEPPSD